MNRPDTYTDEGILHGIHCCLDPEISIMRERNGYGPPGKPQLLQLIRIIELNAYNMGKLEVQNSVKKALGIGV